MVDGGGDTFGVWAGRSEPNHRKWSKSQTERWTTDGGKRWDCQSSITTGKKDCMHGTVKHLQISKDASGTLLKRFLALHCRRQPIELECISIAITTSMSSTPSLLLESESIHPSYDEYHDRNCVLAAASEPRGMPGDAVSSPSAHVS